MPFSATRELWLVLKARDEANRALRSFSGNVRNVGRQVQMAEALAGKADAQRLLRMQRLRGATAGEMQDTKNLIDAYDRQYRQLKVLDAQHEAHRQTLLRYNDQLNRVSATAASAGLVLTGLGVAAMFGVKNLVDSAVAYEQQVRKTITQVDGFKTSLDELSQVGLEVARNIAVPLEQVQASLYDIFSSTDANVKQAKILLEAFAKTAVAGQVDLQDASRGTIAILNSFNIPFENVNALMDVQFQLVRKGVGTYGEFAKVFGRIVPSATRAGQNFETVAAMLAFLTRNGLSAAMAATSGARALDAFSHPKSVKALERMGIKMRDVKGQLVPLVDILDQLRTKVMKLPPADRVGALVDIFKGAGGTIQARRFIEQVLLRPGELEQFKGFLKDMQNAGGAFSAAYNEMADTAASKSQLLANRWEAVKIAAGNALIPSFIKVIDWLGKLFEWFNKLPKGTQELITKIIAAAAVFTTLLGILLLIVSGVAAVTAAITVAGAAFFVVTGIILGLVAAFVALAAGIFLAWQKSETFRQIISELMGDLKTLWYDILVPFGLQVAELWKKHMQPALEELWAVIRDKVLPVFREIKDYIEDKLRPAIQELVNWVKDQLGAAFYVIGRMIRHWLIPALEAAVEWYHHHEGAVKNVIYWVIFLTKWILKLALAIAGPLIVAFGLVILSFLSFIMGLMAIFKLIEIIVNFIKKLVNEFRGVDDGAKRIAKGIGETFKGFQDKVIGIKNTIVNSFKELIRSFFTVGQDMIMGLINGVIDKGEAAVKKIKSVGASILSGIKLVLGVRSPSKEFMKIGRDSIAGFILGFNGGAARVPTVFGNMARTMGTNAIIGRGAGNGNSINQEINVYTQEINPRRHAEELGFLYGARP
jgi:TP901 family phage tail tape measure protein